jgi:Lon protease (S16) C-terminal proteolytic domain
LNDNSISAWPIGGAKEKDPAANRTAIRRAVLLKENEKDLREIPDDVSEVMKTIFFERVEDGFSAPIPVLAERMSIRNAA